MVEQNISPTGRSRGRYARGTLTRERIIRAAADTVAEHGIAGFTLTRVAANADVSKAGVLHHFRSTDAMLSQLIAEHGRALGRSLRTATCPAEFVRILDQFSHEYPQISRLYGEIAFDSGRAVPISHRLLVRLRAVSSRQCSELSSGQPESAARLLAALDGALVARALTDFERELRPQIPEEHIAH